jgi:AcrR family transcriptional regulator
MTDIEVSRRERKKDETRERIFKVAIKLFRDRGFDRTTIDDITEKADVAKGTFFNYFPKKDAVLAYLSETRLVAVEENAGAMLAATKPTADKLVGIYEFAATAYEEDRDLSRFVINELMSRAFAPNEEPGVRWQKLVLDVIEGGRAAGELRGDLDAVRAESLLSSVYMSTVYLWLNCNEAQFDLREELRARLTLVLEGCAARKIAP